MIAAPHAPGRRFKKFGTMPVMRSRLRLFLGDASARQGLGLASCIQWRQRLRPFQLGTLGPGSLGRAEAWSRRARSSCCIRCSALCAHRCLCSCSAVSAQLVGSWYLSGVPHLPGVLPTLALSPTHEAANAPRRRTRAAKAPFFRRLMPLHSWAPWMQTMGALLAR